MFGTVLFVFNLCEETISRSDEGQPRPKYIFNKCGTNNYFFTLQRFSPSPSPNFKAKKLSGPGGGVIKWEMGPQIAMCTNSERMSIVISRQLEFVKFSYIYLHLLVPTLDDPANHGSKMKIHRKVSHLRIALSRAGLSLSLSPLRNQWTECLRLEDLFLLILIFLKYYRV